MPQRKLQKPKKRNEPSDLWEAYRKAEPYLSLGITFTVTILAFLFFGRWLDTKLGTSPWLLITGAALGMILGFVHMIATLNNLSEQEKKEKEQESGHSD